MQIVDHHESIPHPGNQNSALRQNVHALYNKLNNG